MKKLSPWRVEILLFCLGFVSYAYFFNGAGWNQNARYNSIYSFVEPGTPQTHTFQIDRFIYGFDPYKNTGDWSYAGGHYYSNKAPGSSILGIPVYFLLYHLQTLFGIDPTDYGPVVLNAYMINLFVSVFWSALSLVLMYWISARLIENKQSALMTSLVFGFCTMMFPFSTQLWGHTTAVAMTLIGLYFLILKEGSPADLLKAGFFFSAAVLIDYISALTLIGIFAYLVFTKRHWRPLLYFCLGAAPCILALMIYQKTAFGGFFTPASAFSNPAFLEEKRVFGQFGGIDFYRMHEILTSLKVGLFFYMPIFLLIPLGIVHLGKRRKDLMHLCWIMLVLHILLVSSFVGLGGRTSGPRYLILSLPFWCLLLPHFHKLGESMRSIFLFLLLFSAANMLVISSVNVMTSLRIPNPLFGSLYGQFLSGKLAVAHYLYHAHPRAFSEGRAFNLGFFLTGTKNLISLIPILLIWGFGFTTLFKWNRR